jgi:sterol 3beta-glucosyltransferase
LAADPKPVYIGFGSIVVPDPDELTRIVVEGVRRAGCRAILSKGWSGRAKENNLGSTGAETSSAAGSAAAEPEWPSFIYPIKSIPHDWLFPRIAGVVHHGGAGTTAAGIRAGVPTIIKPFFGDQFFWGLQVEEVRFLLFSFFSWFFFPFVLDPIHECLKLTCIAVFSNHGRWGADCA